MCGGKKPSKSRTNRVIGKLYGKKAQQAHAARNGLTNRMKVSNRARSGTTGSRNKSKSSTSSSKKRGGAIRK